MAKLPLHQGSYQARSPIANNEICINLYPESNPQDAPFPVTHYPAPGLAIWADYTGTFSGPCYGLYTTSSGELIAAIGNAIVNVSVPGTPIVLGGLLEVTGNPVIMCDNGVDLVVVNGSPNGYIVGLAQLGVANSLTQIIDSAFYGSTRVDYIDTFMIFNQQGTGNFYTTTSGVVLPFDPTYVAAKEGWNDRLVCACCLHDNIWLLGNVTTEVWFNAGGTTFPFSRMPNSILQQGCAAPYSATIADNAIYWLSQDRWGHAMMMRGEGYAAKRISTFAVENAWNTYATINDCVGMAYQIGGHETVGFWFPTGDAWWGYDASTQMWHQRMNGTSVDAWLPRCTAFNNQVYGVTAPPNFMLAGDRTGPRIFIIDRNTYTDAGNPIQRLRSWSHVQEDGQRLYHTRFSCSMTGAALTPDDVIALDWSDDAGQTFGAQVNQTTNNQTNGQYQWRRLGYARDRVYRLRWSGQGECALNGAYIDVVPGAT